MHRVLKLHSLSWPPGGDSSGCIEVYASCVKAAFSLLTTRGRLLWLYRSLCDSSGCIEVYAPWAWRLQLGAQSFSSTEPEHRGFNFVTSLWCHREKQDGGYILKSLSGQVLLLLRKCGSFTKLQIRSIQNVPISTDLLMMMMMMTTMLKV